MKYLLTFIAGVVVGVIVALYYEVLSKPVLPSEPFDYERMARTLMDTPLMPSKHWSDWIEPDDYLADTQPVKTLSDESIELKWALVDAVTEIERMKKTLADTQPVRVEKHISYNCPVCGQEIRYTGYAHFCPQQIEEWEAWHLAIWAEESE